ETNEVLPAALDSVRQIQAVAEHAARLPCPALIGRERHLATVSAAQHQSVAAARIVDAPGLLIRRCSRDHIWRVEFKNDMIVAFFDHALAIATALEIRFIRIDSVSVTRLAGMITGALTRSIHLIGLIHPGE